MPQIIRILLYILASFGIIAVGLLIFALISRIRNRQRVKLRLLAHIHGGNRGLKSTDYIPEADDVERAKEGLNTVNVASSPILPG